jgi:hypothetical protein
MGKQTDKLTAPDVQIHRRSHLAFQIKEKIENSERGAGRRCHAAYLATCRISVVDRLLVFSYWASTFVGGFDFQDASNASFTFALRSRASVSAHEAMTRRRNVAFRSASAQPTCFFKGRIGGAPMRKRSYDRRSAPAAVTVTPPILLPVYHHPVLPPSLSFQS